MFNVQSWVHIQYTYVNTRFETGIIAFFFNSLRSRQKGWHFPDDTFKHFFLNENVQILIKISPKFVPKGPVNNIPALVQIMAWCRPGDKPLSEPMMVRLPTHICVTRPQWFKATSHFFYVMFIIICVLRQERVKRKVFLLISQECVVYDLSQVSGTCSR